MTYLSKQATHFRRLNQQGDLLLPNAWDAASARIFEQAGFPAIATTSGGIAYAQGHRDAERIGRDAMLAQIAVIVQAVAVPVSADVEAGYGTSPAAVAETVQRVIDVGAAGINVEDNTHGQGDAPLYATAAQCARLAAAREAAEQAAVPLWINARTDAFLLGLGANDDERAAMTIARANAYLAAGADMVFIPGVTDVGWLARLATAIRGPINVMATPGAPSAAELFHAGACRVSMGVFPMLAVMGAIRAMAREAQGRGTWQAMSRDGYGFAEAEALFA